MDRMIFFNTAWMKYYQGDLVNDPPLIIHGFIQSEGWGGEILNFMHFDNRTYGYVETAFRHTPWYAHYGIHIEELGAALNQPSINYVTVRPAGLLM